MFTGIIEEVGRVLRFEEHGGQRRLTVSSTRLVRELNVGDSIAVSGACLTAVEITPESFSADLAAETITRTSLSRLAPGALVNLELPARAGDRLGGHIVQGHVDGTGELLSLQPIANAEDYWLEIRLPSVLGRYVVEKGSIAVEGISLTIASVETGHASSLPQDRRDAYVSIGMAIIPHTAQATNLLSLKSGEPVNIEVDVMAKYAEKLRRRAETSQLTVAELIAAGF